jgi:hypothetical protein
MRQFPICSNLYNQRQRQGGDNSHYLNSFIAFIADCSVMREAGCAG